MPLSQSRSRLQTALGLVLLLWLASLPVKLIAAYNMVWDIDIVPVVAQGSAWFSDGVFPAYGTLSSVAAYNLPGLVWLHLPAQLLTHDPYWIMLLTLLAFNLVSTVYVFLLGRLVANTRVGLIAALLFTFSAISVSGSYTAWAQLLLPGFFAMTAYHLLRWCLRESGRDLALAGILATFAFMTHFSAVLLYGALLAVALIARPRWHLVWLAAGAGVCVLLLAPYGVFQLERNFVDLRAFFSQESTLSAETLERYAYLQSGNPQAPDTTANPSAQAAPVSPDAAASSTENATPSFTARLLRFAASVPAQFIQASTIGYNVTPRALQKSAPVAAFSLQLIMLGLYAGFILGCALAAWRVWRAKTVRGQPSLWLLAFLLALTSGLIVTGTAPWENATYYSGLIGLQWVFTAYALSTLPQPSPNSGSELQVTKGGTFPLHTWETERGLTIHKAVGWLLVGMLVSYALLHSAERIERIRQHNDAAYSNLNVWLYRHIDDATAWIAQDWREAHDTATLSISYDFWPEMAHIWWVVPWHEVDAGYRMGMSYDYLLRHLHGLHNRNQNPVGLADDADYLVTYNTHDLSAYDAEAVRRSGAIVVVKLSD